MRLPSKAGIYWGWYVVAAAFLAGFAASSASAFTFSTLVVPMSQAMGWSRTQLFFAVTLAGISAGIVSPIAGRLADKYGARHIVAGSALFLGISLLLTSQVRELWQYYIVFGIGLGSSRPLLQSVGGPTAVVNWFVKKRNRVLSIVSFSTPASVVMTIPVAFLATNYGWRWAWVLLSAVTLVLAVVPAWLFIRKKPEDMGLLPDGASSEEAKAAPSEGRKKSSLTNPDHVWRLSHVLRTRAFWLITANVILTGVPGGTIILHMGAYFSDRGFSPASAAFAVFLYGVGAGIGRLLWGVLGEWITIKPLIIARAFSYAFWIVVLLLAPGLGELAGYASVVILGAIVGGGQQLNIQAWADYFGRGTVGTILGVETLFGVISSGGGPIFAAWMFDRLGSYNAAFSIFSGLCVLAGITMLFAEKPRAPDQAPLAVKAQGVSPSL